MIERNEPIESMTKRLQDYDTFIEDAKYYDYTIENLEIDKTIEKILNIIHTNQN